MNFERRDPDRPADEASVARFEEPGIRGFVHRPQAAATGGLVLTHGAGSDCRSPLLVAAASVFSNAGLLVLRCDLPFRQRRAKGPPSPATAAADRDGLRQAVAAMRGLVPQPGRLLLGGVSYGGRQATMLAADEPELAAGLLLFSYPLHPPGKPLRLRTEHFAASETAGGVRPRHRRPVRLDRRTAPGVGADPGADRVDPGRRRRPRSEARAFRFRAGERGAAAPGFVLRESGPRAFAQPCALGRAPGDLRPCAAARPPALARPRLSPGFCGLSPVPKPPAAPWVRLWVRPWRRARR